jgi:hypothetical protein
MNYLKERLKEKSTWSSIFSVAGTILGISIAPEYTEAITIAAIAILGGTAFMTKVKK